MLLASRAGKLGGIRGALAELVQVPERFDTAIEVALGGHLQDIVVERWTDAEAAIALLKRNGSGRATFQPLDTVRASRGAPTGIQEALRLTGVHGIAAELIDFSPEIEAVVTSLLGRSLVVEDLEIARAALPKLPNGWSAVTRGGEIARSGGSVTGGAAVRESGMLGRERELRELPEEIARLQQTRADALKAANAAGAQRQEQIERRQALEGERTALIAARKERQSQRARFTGWMTEVKTEVSGYERRLTAIGAAAIAAQAERSELIEAQDDLAEQLTAAQQQHASARQALEREGAESIKMDAELGAEQRKLAGLEERIRSERKREAGLLAQRRALDDELGLRAQRAATLDGEIVALAAQRERLTKEADQLTTARDAVQREHPPLEAAVKEHERELTRLERSLETGRSALLDAERSRGAVGLGVERLRGEVATIRQRITDELELLEPSDLLDQEIPQPEGAENPTETEREIARLKDRLRRVGYVGENVVEEYEREAERHAFLRTQLDDVEGASGALRELLADLHQTMRQRFDETFSRVAAAFSEMFTILFGGGTARLVMTAGNNGDGGGIDIVAQPPGKRLQSLGLLSGGERALTAGALLFAILRVNPTPFCLLDEVDAALDEANVVRFRDQLEALAAETQAIIITHNRGTIEVADTLYGVSMRDDGVSQVLSLRLADVALAGE